MGTTAHVAVIGGPPGLCGRAAARIADLERRWSRFRPDSELSRLNGAPADVEVRVSEETFTLVDRAVTAWHRTAGQFDPTVLASVIAQGYDRPFTAIPVDRDGPEPRAEAAPGCAGIRVDRHRRAVALPPGVGIDPGGIGKGLAADLVAGELLAAGAAGALVDLGGDIRVVGDGPCDGRWVIDVEHPGDAERVLLHLALTDVGLATSSRLRRRWRVNRRLRHHVIDPATGEPTATPVVGATVVAPETWWAEALTKVLLVSGRLAGLDDAAAVAVTEDGAALATQELAELLS